MKIKFNKRHIYPVVAGLMLVLGTIVVQLSQTGVLKSLQQRMEWLAYNVRLNASLPEKIVEERTRVGDYERDSVLGRGGRILSIVDRTSKLTKLGKLKSANAIYTHHETINLLKDEIVHTITNDNGPEFGCHDLTSMALKAKVYFTMPNSPWQRGTNENTNVRTSRL